MTDQLFARTAPLPAPRPAERLGRFVLHRAGIVNVWQYDRAEMSFAGGRMLLRGKNGAGKSKALEVLLPFVLDGDTRLIDATGRDRTTVTWLMTDGRDPGNHVGYVWLEFRLTCPGETVRDDELEDTFITVGAGLKASSATRQSATWFFMTDRARVGESLHLAPEVSLDRLREQLGPDAVSTSGTEHRRRVASRLFGVHDDARYQSLIHLLHRLRDPNIGNRVDAGELSTVLREALPPVSDKALDKAAERFETLDQIREQLERVEKTAVELARCLRDYVGYAKARLCERAKEVVSAGTAARRAARERERLGAEVERCAAEQDEAEKAVSALQVVAARTAAVLAALRASEAYQQHRQLDDRRHAVASKAAQADTADDAARAQAEMAHDITVQHERALALVEEVALVVTNTRRSLEHQATAAGLDPAIVPADSDGIDAASVVAADRRRAAQQVRALAVGALMAVEDARRADEQSARSEAELAERQREAHIAGEAWLTATAQWSTALVEWPAAELPAILTGEDGATLDASGLRLFVSGLSGGAAEADLAEAAMLARRAVAPVRDAARTLETRALSHCDRSEAALGALETEHTALEAQDEARPVRSRFRDSERDATGGAPFYELVDVVEGLAPHDIAGLEAALESSGLLDAWVSKEGIVVHPATHDVIWGPDASKVPLGTRTLADVLIALSDHVAPLLSSIALEAMGSGPFVTLDGRWALPPLSGAWAKASSEFLGAPTRRMTRERRLAELAGRIAEQRHLLAAAERHRDEAAAATAFVDDLVARLPSEREVLAASADSRSAGRTAEAARARHDDDRRVAEGARTRSATARLELTHAAAADGLPITIDELDLVASSASELRSGLQRWRSHWLDLGRYRYEAEELSRRRDERDLARRAAAEAAAALRCELDAEQVGLHTLEDAVGESVEVVLAQIDDALRRQREASGAEPAAQARVTELAGERGRLVERHDESGRAFEAATHALHAAALRLEVAVHLPGVADAALGELGELWRIEDDPDPARSAAGLLERLGDFTAVSDSTILNRLQVLELGLRGGYDVVSDETDGLKFVLIADDRGRHPLPAVAARVLAEAEAARERLAAGERETIERFLLGELAEDVRERLLEAHDLVRSANQALSGVRSSHGIGARLDWALDDDAASGSAREAAHLLIRSPRSPDEDDSLRDALMDLIRAERERDPVAGYAEHLRNALDYRRWHRFTVMVTNDARPGSLRVLSPRVGLSQGEQRVLSYLALFSAASAHFDGLGDRCPRLLLLDDAFAKVDEPTHGRLLELLVDLDLDFMITSERMWGCHSEVPSLDIYEALRDQVTPGVALVHFHWDGHKRYLVGL